MFAIELSQVEARVWRGYHKNTSGWLPRRMAWLEPAAAEDFKRMNAACENRIEYLDVFRSARYQIQCIKGATDRKRRLYAPPTKSGHNFGFSIDLAVDETLQNFKKSGDSELVTAARDVHALGRWMKRWGWSPIKKERWHFNHLGGHATTVKKIDAIYGQELTLDNEAVQRALNKLLDESLEIDGILGTKSSAAAARADRILMTGDGGDFGPWFRRVLSGATATIREV